MQWPDELSESTDALQEFSQPGLGSKDKHLLFLTDGAPTQGDAELEDEQAWAKRLGVSITRLRWARRVPCGAGHTRAFNQRRPFPGNPRVRTGVIRLWDRADGPPPASMDAAANQASSASTDTGGRDAAGLRTAGSREPAHDAFATDTLRSGERSALQRDENLAAKGRLSEEEVEQAMKLMSMGRVLCQVTL